jgi:bleomycin hydrolase
MPPSTRSNSSNSSNSSKALKAPLKASKAVLKAIHKDAAKMTVAFQAVTESITARRIEEYEARTAPQGEALNPTELKKYRAAYQANPVANALATLPASYLAENRAVLQAVNYTYSDILPRCPGATSQSNSGRCWMFAALNAMRFYIIKNLNLNDYFELSEAYLFFYDKIERSLFFLEKMLELRARPLTDPVIFGMTHVSRPIDDGGTFGFFRNLIDKYGIVPKSCYGESFNTQCSEEMNEILWCKLGQFAHEIRTSGKSEATLRKHMRTVMMPEIYALMVRFLGEPPQTFTWSYNESGENVESVREKGAHHRLPDLTPLGFYETYVVPFYNPQEKVVLRHDPRKNIKANTVYSSEHHGHMVGAPPNVDFNVDLAVLKKAVADSIAAEQPVWFACDVGKDFNPEYSLLSTEAFNYAGLFQTDFLTDKAAMLEIGLSGATHAMLIVGVDKTAEQDYVKWRVENSWGEWPGEDPGYLQMSDAWFDRYVYEAVVNLDLLPAELQKIYQANQYKPIYLDYNDPFGAVAIK